MWTGSRNTLFVGKDVVDVGPLAEAVTSCHDVLCSLLNPVFAHAQIFRPNVGSVVFVCIENEGWEMLESCGFVWIRCIVTFQSYLRLVSL